MRERNLRPARGFVLVIALLVALAAAAVAVAVTNAGGDARIRAVHTEHADLAAGIAHAGMQRMRAYATSVATGGSDFDELLDPGLLANCAGLPGSQPTCPTCNMPNFSDDAVQSYRGKNYARVAYNTGAYLVRIEDDNDDQQAIPEWLETTVPGCDEGPTTLNGADNPVRDRNKTVVITVIGYSPGLDPDRAQHRTVLRQVQTNNAVGTRAAITVGGNVEANPGTKFFGCSAVGHMEVQGNLANGGPTDSCMCGDSLSQNGGGSWAHCTAPGISAQSQCAATSGCASGALGPSPPVPPVTPDVQNGKNFYFDFTTPCTIFVQENANNTALWFWEPGANRGPNGALCSDVVGDASVTGPPIPPAPGANSYARCWTPLLIGATLPGTCVKPWSTDGGALLTGCMWAPSNQPETINSASMNAALTAAGVANFNAGASFTKPDWSTCQIVYPNNNARSCAPNCNGTTAAMARALNANHYFFKGDTAAEIGAVPAAVYLYSGDIALQNGLLPATGDEFVTVAPSGNQTINIAQWPLATIATTGNVTVNAAVFFGTGIDRPGVGARFPSIVASGNVTFSGTDDKLIAGSIYSTGNLTMTGASSTFLFGEVHTNGNWSIQNVHEMNWRYFESFQPAAGGAAGVPGMMLSSE